MRATWRSHWDPRRHNSGVGEKWFRCFLLVCMLTAHVGSILGDRMRGKFRRKNSIAVVTAVVASLIASVAFVGAAVQPAAASNVQAPHDSQPWCEDYLIVGVAGSGQHEGYGTQVGAAVNHLKAKIEPSFGVRDIVIDYPAAHIAVLAQDLANSTFNTDNWEYFASISAGQTELMRQLEAAATDCPHEKWILIGYSQGALVIHQAAYSIFSRFEKIANQYDRIRGVMLIANPARSPFSNGAEARGHFGNAAPGFGIVRAIPGIYSPGYYPWELERYTTEVCMEADPVCDHLAWQDSMIGLWPFGAEVHTNIPEIFITQAADMIVDRVYTPSMAIPTSVPTIEAEGPNAVKVSWSPFKEENAPVTKYSVYLSSPEAVGDGFVGQLYAEVDSTTHSVVIHGLTAGEVLVARIYAYVSYGENAGSGLSSSPPSQPVTVLAATVPPPQHDHLTLFGRTTTSVSFGVTALPEDGGNPLTGYRVTTADLTVLGYPETQTFFEGHWDVLTITGLRPGTAYRFVVDPCNINGCAENSEPQIVHTEEATPDAPSNVNVHGIESTSATVEWTAAGTTPVTYYVVVIDSMLEIINMTVDASQEAKVTVGALLPSTEYKVSIYAVNDAGAGSRTAPVAFKTLAPPIPLTPDAPSVSLEGVNSLAVTWLPPESNGAVVTGYEVTWRDGHISQSRRVAADTTSTTFTGLEGDRSYTTTVAAIGIGGISAPSAPSLAVYVPGEMPAAPPAAVPARDVGGKSDPGLVTVDGIESVEVSGVIPNRWYYASRAGLSLGEGWYLSDSDGNLSLTVGANAKPGNHRLVIQTKEGALVGSAPHLWTPSTTRSQQPS